MVEKERVGTLEREVRGGGERASLLLPRVWYNRNRDANALVGREGHVADKFPSITCKRTPSGKR